MMLEFESLSTIGTLEPPQRSRILVTDRVALNTKIFLVFSKYFCTKSPAILTKYLAYF